MHRGKAGGLTGMNQPTDDRLVGVSISATAGPSPLMTNLKYDVAHRPRPHVADQAGNFSGPRDFRFKRDNRTEIR